MLSGATKAVPTLVGPRQPTRIVSRVFDYRSRRPACYVGNAEPSLDEVIGDPMVRHLMERDGVVIDSLLSMLDEVRLRLR
ncbi:hypothetical protein [Magnetospirillum molischianum]|uniref:Uncharacterized protein n=1 Tax=Magnetospirillum molischianum DSM 120 TaxID=1150626 RepID=H8FRP8_MAGML|nr:hypothetical protein [Magnetospirillum molischianum]CCG41036.1 conserved hypothetical protein [Magnetospirillum molischianum DSM 120]